MSLLWLVVADKMWPPGAEFAGEQLAQYRRLEASPGPQDRWRVHEDRAATRGKSQSARAREAVGVDPEAVSLWFGGISLTFADVPPVVAISDYPSVAGDRQRAASELDRLAGLGEIRWHA